MQMDSNPVGARRPRILLGATGSVASIKIPELAVKLAAIADVKVVATAAATHFFTEDELPVSCRPLLGDESDWRSWQKVGDEVLHIELRRWADLIVIAPLSADTLAKLAGGLCDNLLTCIFRAWDFQRPVLVAPAMNTYMWDSSFTEQHLDRLKSLGVRVVPPVSKKLACGDSGMGAMASSDQILHAVQDVLQRCDFRLADA